MAKKNDKFNDMNIESFIGEATNFKGLLEFKSTIRIDGRVEGEIISKDALIVGETAEILAEIRVGAIYINGTIKGNIVAKERIEIFSTGKVFGNIKTPILIINEGVIFEGTCEMKEKKLEDNQGVINVHQAKIVKGSK